jgi:8-oxo-dGTP pyrophosphatase MutT (NUDIX family)
MRDGSAPKAPLTWSLWGGAFEPDDLGPCECAARELREELGIDAHPTDFTLVGTRSSSTQKAVLMRYAPPLGWRDFSVNEGAGAGFFWRDEIERLSVSIPLRYYFDNYTALFAARPENS